MSQHYFQTEHQGKPVTVTLGWDRPLGHYFMLIEKDDDEDSPFYTNMNEKDPFSFTDVAFFKGKLDEFGIKVPETMFEQIQLDKAYNTGNRYVSYQADGSFEE